MGEKMRCSWCESSDAMRKYHDEEWGVPLHDSRKLFGKFVLDSFQAGLSWSTILNKKENFVKAFDGFDPMKIAKYGEKDKKRLMGDTGIIRNRLKIESAIANAKAYLEIEKEFGSFDQYIWQFTKGKTIVNKPKTTRDIPATSKESDAMSKDMKIRGFKFCGSTICYAFMQATGMVDDHVLDCHRK